MNRKYFSIQQVDRFQPEVTAEVKAWKQTEHFCFFEILIDYIDYHNIYTALYYIDYIDWFYNKHSVT